MSFRTRPSYYLALFATSLAMVVVILGAYTRLKDAGLGCPDWPGCYGHFYMPGSAAEIATANELYPDSPFEADKAWPEVIHRYFATALGMVILIIAALAIRNRNLAEQPFKLPLFLVFMVILQGMFGMWTVTLKLWPQVVTTHLLGGFTTLSLLWLLCLRLDGGDWLRPVIGTSKEKSLRILSVIGLVIVVMQILLGGWTSSNYAALACPDFPTCQNQWWPSMDFSSGFNFFQSIGPDYLGGLLDAQSRVAIHMTHRIGAIITAGYLFFLFSQLIKHSGSQELDRIAWIILLLLLVQLGLGLSNIFWQIPLPVATAHNACGALLLLSLVNLNYRLFSTTHL